MAFGTKQNGAGAGRLSMMGSAIGMGQAAMEHLAQLLHESRQTRRVLESKPDMVAVTDAELQPGHEVGFPWKGAKRIAIRRSAVGGDLVVPAGGGLVVAANNRRLGGSIVNQGGAAVTLVLSDQVRPGVGHIWLATAGGAWDFRLGDLLWCGAVFALPGAGGATLSVAEV